MIEENIWQEEINERYEPLEFEIKAAESYKESDILIWHTNIGGVNIRAQSSGNFEEQTTEPYALSIWEENEFMPVLKFLKEHEEELAEYVKNWREKNARYI